MIIIKNALDNIKTNKLRVIVAMIWIVLGITSVVVVDSVGNGIESMGAKNLDDPKFREIEINFYPDFENNIDPALLESFTTDDIDKISLIKGVERVSAKYGNHQSLTYGAMVEYGQDNIFSNIEEYSDKLNLQIEYGRLFAQEDLNRRTIVLDNDIAFRLFDTNMKEHIGKPVVINGESFELIGILKKDLKTTEIEDSYDTSKVYLSRSTIDELNNSQSFGSTITGISVLVGKGYNKEDVGFSIIDNLNSKSEEHGEYDFKSVVAEIFELNYIQQIINRFTSILSKVSLFIGGIGIMNIMYMSVTERQREIGIRRAIGAQPKDILLQFLIETIVITILGGIVGIIVGTITSGFISSRMGIDAIPTAKVYFDAVSTSVMIGAIFGSIPAYKASNLDPIKAIQG